MIGGCIFCRIIKGEIPSHTVYDDEFTLAFLDVNPISKGHTLIIPKTHVRQIEDLDEVYSVALFKTVSKLTKHVQRAMNTNASVIGINNGEESGQEIPHIHVHIIPRIGSDGGGPIHSIMKTRPYMSTDELRKVAQTIRLEISRNRGTKCL